MDFLQSLELTDLLFLLPIGAGIWWVVNKIIEEMRMIRLPGHLVRRPIAPDWENDRVWKLDYLGLEIDKIFEEFMGKKDARDFIRAAISEDYMDELVEYVEKELLARMNKN